MDAVDSSQGTLIRVLVVLSFALLASLSCHAASISAPPCPRPSFALVPMIDTISTGTTVKFAPGPELSSAHGAILWSSSDARVAVVDTDGMATAISRGSVQVRALDSGSPPSCPDQWYGTLVVH